MVRLRIALGVASSLVAVAAVSIVLSGTGQAQGNAKVQSVEVVNTPLPVTGNVTATVSGNVSANIINPANDPVLIRDVGAKEPWQESSQAFVSAGVSVGIAEFSPVPAGKLLVIEHLNVSYQSAVPGYGRPDWVLLSKDGGPPSNDGQYFFFKQLPTFTLADAATKFYVYPGATPRLVTIRTDTTGDAGLIATMTGHFVNYP